MPKARIRPLSLAIVRRNDDLLVLVGHDPKTKERFHRPLGGGIEFGESGIETVCRELFEELDAELTDVRYLGTLENIFTYDGTAGHEIIQLYEATLADRTLYGREDIVGLEGTTEIPVRWLPLQLVRDGHEVLYPDGLINLFDKQHPVFRGRA